MATSRSKRGKKRGRQTPRKSPITFLAIFNLLRVVIGTLILFPALFLLFVSMSILPLGWWDRYKVEFFSKRQEKIKPYHVPIIGDEW